MVSKEFSQSLRYRFLKDMAIILALSTCVLTVCIALNERTMLKNSLTAKGLSYGANIAKRNENALTISGSVKLDTVLSELVTDEEIIYTVIADNDGRLLTTQFESINYKWPGLKDILQQLPKGLELPEMIAAIKTMTPVREVSVPIKSGADTLGRVTIGMSEHKIDAQIVKTVFFVIGLNLLVASVLGAVLFVTSKKTVLDPIIALSNAARRLAKGDLSTQVEFKAMGEVKVLIDSFNNMAENLQKTTVSKNYVDDIIASMGDTLMVAATDGTILRTNLATHLLLGYDEAELVGQPLSLVVIDEPGAEKPLVETILASSDLSSLDKTYRAKEGKIIPMSFSASVMRGSDGQILGIVCVAKDITERKQAEEALRESAINLTATLNATADGILASSAEGKIYFYNQRFVQMLKVPQAILETGHDKDLLGYVTTQVADPEGFYQEVQRLFASEENSFNTIALRDGRVFERYSFPLLREGAGILGRVWSFRDITERKAAAEKLEQYSAELQEINEEIKSFAYIISHDLRAPLVNIRGFSEELGYSVKELTPLLEGLLADRPDGEREKLNDLLHKDIPEAITYIGSSVVRMDNLINAILKLSRAGRRELSPERLSVQDLIGAIVGSLTHQLVAREAQVKITGTLPDLIIDKTALEQVFGNLLDNAVKYLEPGRAGLIEIAAEPGDDEVVFHVRDNGRGMAKEDIPKAFEIFRRVGRQDVVGDGMGLPYVKTLVRQLGGRIWCESELGRGTSFSFTLPRAGATKVAEPPRAG